MVNQLLAAGLVDELWLFRYPVVLGHGKRLFDGSSLASSFSVAYSKNTSDGVAINRYERGGEVRIGTFRK
jgi:dihydrofolate reductase